MQHTVIGTAGHIDHGKSSLVRALTGTDPDRFKEEKEREMTIDLGFAFLGEDITFIDVPGHEKFIKNMLSGVTTVDAVILVIAADDGFMPQTEEHFEILKLLNVERGMVALTKIDMVDPDWLDLVEDDIRQKLEGSFLEDAPIYRIDSLSGKGIPEINDAILKLAAELPPKPDRGVFRMYADRIFSMRGSGTVIAGTVLGGRLKPGDRAIMLPKQLDVRIKRIQVHNKEVPETRIGERAAINLQGIETSQIERGDLLAEKGYFKPTYMLNVSYTQLASAIKPLVNRERVRVHLGTAEYLARAVPLEKKPIAAGETGYLQLRLEAPVACEIGDRLIVRNYSPGRSIGGGKVLEVHPEKLKYLPDEELEVLEALDGGDAGDLVEQHIRRNGFQTFTAQSVAHDVSRPAEEVTELIDKLLEEGKLLSLTGGTGIWVLHRDVFNASREQLLKILEEYHQSQPFRLGLKRSELASKLFGKVDNALYDVFLDMLVKSGEIELSGIIVLKKGHQIQFTKKQSALVDKIIQIYWDAGFVTPEFEEMVEQLEAPEELVKQVILGITDRGDLLDLGVKIGKALIYHTKRIEEAREIILKL
ncbi:selenocysteine-specific translation elongation factor, partial [bacterium]|nr:selenocysteine-specific translation elongation factor [bacterium]